MLRSLRGAGRFGLALGVGVAVAIGGAWVGARAETPGASHTKLVAQRVAKKKTKANKKGMANPVEDVMPRDDDAAMSPGDDKGVKFSRDIAPLLVNVCARCHFPKNDNAKAAALNLTTFEGLMKGTAKGKAIVPGKPDESHLILRIRGDEQPRCPPATT